LDQVSLVQAALKYLVISTSAFAACYCYASRTVWFISRATDVLFYRIPAT